ncbi:MAG TPA: imidazole glycerol phosphate synthase subunit HisH [Tepidisphaeraceae bacterium]|jgi:glutamine amidotransferase|nr:imidazole glycerol phosphate synthase subunit HisH [Tepidisphaeraceae bacterium]
MSSIAIIDYGMANLRSVQKAFEQVHHPADILSTPDKIANYDRIVLPGVGAFKDAVATLHARGFADPIKSHIAKGRPFLGICLGLQMLFDIGYEDGEHAGLGVLRGQCVRFDVDTTLNLKVPHMGWNQLSFKTPSPLFDDLADGSNVYFVHGYHVTPADPSIIAATTDYGRPFVSSIRQGNIFATQFHPEKSQKVGLQILHNFATKTA